MPAIPGISGQITALPPIRRDSGVTISQPIEKQSKNIKGPFSPLDVTNPVAQRRPVPAPANTHPRNRRPNILIAIPPKRKTTPEIRGISVVR